MTERDIERWIQQRRSALEGNPSEFARGYESALDDFEEREDTAEQIAEKHGQLIEFGRAVKQLEDAAASLRRNGHATVAALEGAEQAIENLETVFAEYEEMRKFQQEERRKSREVAAASEHGGEGDAA